MKVIPIMERAVMSAFNPPDNDRKVLIWYKGYYLSDRDRYSWRIGEHVGGHWRPEGGNGNFDANVKYWRELPANPE